MQEWGAKMGREHPRLVMVVLLVGFFGMVAGFVYDALDKDRVSVGLAVALAGASLLAAVAYQVYLWRKGRLVPSREEREARIAEGNRAVQTTLLIATPLIVVGIASGVPFIPFLMLVGGGFVLGYTPLLLWAAFVLRSREE